jgi:hypothetical protein
VFARAAATPRLRLGQLVAVLPHRGADRIERRAAPRPGSGPSRLLLGRVVTLAQTGVPDGREPYGHDVGVSFWPGTAVPVRVKPGAATAFEDAWWLPGGSEGGSVVFARDRFEGPCDALVREPGGDRRLRLTRLLERGVDFDRVEVAPAG